LGEQYGSISRLNAGGKTGFIKSGNKSCFFKVSSLIDKVQLKENLKVSFVTVESFDIKKNQQTIECAYIKIDENK